MFGDLAFNKETGKFANPQQKLQEILDKEKERVAKAAH